MSAKILTIHQYCIEYLHLSLCQALQFIRVQIAPEPNSNSIVAPGMMVLFDCKVW
jgi:hypothetical protein